MLNPTWLTTFKTLADLQHFTATAKALHMTQPGVSQHLQKLEEACGTVLVSRARGHFELTEAGVKLYQYAQDLQKIERRMMASLQRDDPFTGRTRISCSGAVALRLYPRFLSLQRQHCELITEVEAAPSQSIVESVANGSADIGILTANPMDQRFDVEQIGTERLVVVVPNREKLSIKDTLALGLIRHPDIDHYLSIYSSHGDTQLFKGIEIEHLGCSGFVNQLVQILEPVAEGLGFTVLPASVLKHYIRTEAVRLAEPNHWVLQPLYRISRRGRQWPKRYKTLSEVIKEELNAD